MRVVHKKKSKLANAVEEHIKTNIRPYLFTACILLIGITFGVFFVNNLKTEQVQEIQTYINEFIIESLKI